MKGWVRVQVEISFLVNTVYAKKMKESAEEIVHSQKMGREYRISLILSSHCLHDAPSTY